jgi:hypothetical protein
MRYRQRPPTKRPEASATIASIAGAQHFRQQWMQARRRSLSDLHNTQRPKAAEW